METFKKLFALWEKEVNMKTLQAPNPRLLQQFVQIIAELENGPRNQVGGLSQEISTNIRQDFQFLLQDYKSIRFEKILCEYTQRSGMVSELLLYNFERGLKEGLESYLTNQEIPAKGKGSTTRSRGLLEALEPEPSGRAPTGKTLAVEPTHSRKETSVQAETDNDNLIEEEYVSIEEEYYADLLEAEKAARSGIPEEKSPAKESGSKKDEPRKYINGEFAANLPNHSTNFDYTLIRFEKTCEALMGIDLKEYGPFKAEDIAFLPKPNAEALIMRNVAEKIQSDL